MTLVGILGKDKQIVHSMLRMLKSKRTFSLNCYEDNNITIYYDGPLIITDNYLVIIDGELLSDTSVDLTKDVRDLLCDHFISLVKWKKPTKELWLATDRFALKQLYYTCYKGNFIFSSDLESLVKALNIRNINEEVLRNYIVNGFIRPPYTLFPNVFKLRPAELLYLNFEKGKVFFNKYYNLDVAAVNNLKLTDALSIVEKVIDDAVRHAVSERNVKYGVLLSGGLDSSTIAAVAKKYTKNITAITLLNIGEGSIARHISDYLNLPLVELYVTENEFLKALELSFRCLQEPLAGIDIVPSTFLLLKRAKDLKIDVILTGDGGDEAFFGYPWVYKDEIKYSLLKVSPHWCSVGIKNLYSSAKKYLPTFYRTISLLALERPVSIKLTKDKSFEYDEPITRWYRRTYDDIAFCSHGIRRIDDIAYSLGLKSRYPFLDRKFIENLYLLPAQFKQPTMYENKYILRLYLLHNKLLPLEVITLKRKRGLASNVWFSQTLINEYLKLILEDKNPHINAISLKKIIKAKDFHTISALVSFSLWYKKYCQ